MFKITHKNIKKYSENFNQSSKNILARNAINNAHIEDIMINTQFLKQQNEIFSNHIDVKVNTSNQGHSGRCWIFSLVNLIRLKMIDKYFLDENFELSQNYLHFWHKFESANYFLNNIVKTRKQEVDSRLVYSFLDEPISDGGHWCMLINIVEKYGLIPKNQMKETVHSSHSSEVNNYLNRYLRSQAAIIRQLTDKEIDKNLETYLDKILNNIYKILIIFLGEPPQKINWRYYQEKETGKKKKKYISINNITPSNFYKQYVEKLYNLKDKRCLINYPCHTKPFFHKYTVEYSSNKIEGDYPVYYNVPIEVMKECVIKSINKNEAMWMGCDVGQYASTDLGILDTQTIDYKTIFDLDLKDDKCTLLDFREGQVSHAMVIKGYNLEKKQKYPDKYLIENSWGDSTGDNGNFVMSEDWFNQHVYMIVVDKTLISKNITEKFEKNKLIQLPYWSPFGRLLR